MGHHSPMLEEDVRNSALHNISEICSFSSEDHTFPIISISSVDSEEVDLKQLQYSNKMTILNTLC